MDLWDVIKVMWRRWYVAVPLLLVVLAATLGAGTVLKPEYTSTASVLLVPPAERPEEAVDPDDEGNPWIQVGPVAMAEAVSIAVQSKANQDRLAAKGIEAEYQVGVLVRSSIVQVDVAASSPAQVRSAATEVIKLITDEVARRQAPYQSKADQLISTQMLDPGDNVVATRTGIRRGQAMILFAGLLLTAALAVGTDAVLRRRTGGRRPDAGGAPAPSDDATVTLPVVKVPAYDTAQRFH